MVSCISYLWWKFLILFAILYRSLAFSTDNWYHIVLIGWHTNQCRIESDHWLGTRNWPVLQNYFWFYFFICCLSMKTTWFLSWTLERECVWTLWIAAPSWERGSRILIVRTGSVSWLRTEEEERRDT
jgi:hypothetical protein